MVQTKKKNSAAFGDILAGLDQGMSDRAPTAASRMGAARATKKAAEPAADAVEPEQAWGPANQLRRGLGNMAWAGWSRGAADPSASMAGYAEAAAAVSKPAEAESAPVAGAPRGRSKQEQDSGAIPSELEAAPRPIRQLRRLLRNFSWRWRPLHGAAPAQPAAADGMEAGAAFEPAAAAPPKPEPPKPASPNPEPPKPEPPKTEDEAIAAELGLHADLATVDLRRIRRDFAKKNHPDRFEPARRMGAARRMSIANMLIDERLKQKPSGR